MLITKNRHRQELFAPLMLYKNKLVGVEHLRQHFYTPSSRSANAQPFALSPINCPCVVSLGQSIPKLK
jgi:hypothetical protein